MTQPPAQEHPGVARVRAALTELGCNPEIRRLPTSSRTAAEAAGALDVPTAAIASSIVFGMTDDRLPLLVITSGAHRVDTVGVAGTLGLDELHRVDAEYVRNWSGFAIGGVAPLGWSPRQAPDRIGPGDEPEPPFQPRTLVDVSLARSPVLWAAAGHPHYVFRTDYAQLLRITGGEAAEVG